MRKKVCLLLAAALMCCVAAGLAQNASGQEISPKEQELFDYLGNELKNPAAELLRMGENVDDMYS